MCLHQIYPSPKSLRWASSVKLALLTLCVWVPLFGQSQRSGQSLIDSLQHLSAKETNDTVRAGLYYQIAFNYDMIDPKEGVRYARKAMALADSIGSDLEKAWGLNGLGINLVELGDYPAANSAYDRALALFESLGNREAYARVLVNRGTLYKTQSLFPEALAAYQRALDVFKALDKETEVATIMINIGNIYGGLGDHENAIHYYVDALDQIGAEGNPTARAVLEGNLGIAYHDLGQDSLADVYYERSLAAHRRLGNKGWEAMTLGNVASMRYDQDLYEESAHLYRQALEMYRNLELEGYTAWVLIELGLVEIERDNAKEAMAMCQEALEISIAIMSLENEFYACDCLAKAYESLGRFREASAMQRRYIQLDDSIEAQQEHEKVVSMMMEQAFSAQMKVDSLQRAEERLKTALQHKDELHAKNNQRNLSIFIGLLVVAAALGLWGRLRYTRRSKQRIEAEKEVSEKLLLNILPAEVADELKQSGQAKARRFDNVTVLFTDFKGFTGIAAQLSAEDLVEEINQCFKAFDAIIEQYGLEKIKTIGDAYMAAGGLHDQRKSGAIETVQAGIAMQAYITRRKAERDQKGQPAFAMRVGVHSGPVVAGIVGTKKFQYDIWGDTVNMASRMESSGRVGTVNLSETTYRLVRDQIKCVPRGLIDVKGKGRVAMYFAAVGDEAPEIPTK